MISESKAIKTIELFEEYLEGKEALEKFKSNIENLRLAKYEDWRNRQIRAMMGVDNSETIKEYLPFRGFRFRESPEGMDYWSAIGTGWLDYIRLYQ